MYLVTHTINFLTALSLMYLGYRVASKRKELKRDLESLNSLKTTITNTSSR